MSTWRRKSIELFPMLKREIEGSCGSGEAWIYIEEHLLAALVNSDESYIKSVKQYFSWCVSTNLSSEPHQSALCGFLEDVGRNKQYWPFLNIIFTKLQFEYYKGVLGYSLSQEQSKEMEDAFYCR